MVIFCRSRRSAERTLANLIPSIENKLLLKVNLSKIKVTQGPYLFIKFILQDITYQRLFYSYRNAGKHCYYLLMNVKATLNGNWFFVLIVVIIVQKGIIYRKKVS